MLSIVAFYLQEVQTQLFPVSVFPPINRDYEKYTAEFINATQAVGDQRPKRQDKFSPLHLSGSYHSGAVSQMVNKQDLDLSFGQSHLLLGKDLICHSKMMKLNTLRCATFSLLVQTV